MQGTQGGQAAEGQVRAEGTVVSGVWCLLCPEPIPPDPPDTAAPAGLGWKEGVAAAHPTESNCRQ